MVCMQAGQSITLLSRTYTHDPKRSESQNPRQSAYCGAVGEGYIYKLLFILWFSFSMRIIHCRYFQILQISHACIRKIYRKTYTHLSRKNESESRGIYCLFTFNRLQKQRLFTFFLYPVSIQSGLRVSQSSIFSKQKNHTILNLGFNAQIGSVAGLRITSI